MEWINAAINFLMLICIISGSMIAVFILEERRKRK
jgi:hypothetical protein